MSFPGRRPDKAGRLHNAGRGSSLVDAPTRRRTSWPMPRSEGTPHVWTVVLDVSWLDPHHLWISQPTTNVSGSLPPSSNALWPRDRVPGGDPAQVASQLSCLASEVTVPTPSTRFGQDSRLTLPRSSTIDILPAIMELSSIQGVWGEVCSRIVEILLALRPSSLLAGKILGSASPRPDHRTRRRRRSHHRGRPRERRSASTWTACSCRNDRG